MYQMLCNPVVDTKLLCQQSSLSNIWLGCQADVALAGGHILPLKALWKLQQRQTVSYAVLGMVPAVSW